MVLSFVITPPGTLSAQWPDRRRFLRSMRQTPMRTSVRRSGALIPDVGLRSVSLRLDSRERPRRIGVYPQLHSLTRWRGESPRLSTTRAPDTPSEPLALNFRIAFALWLAQRTTVSAGESIL